MTTKTKPAPKKTKAESDKELMHKTISNLTDIVSKLEDDVTRIDHDIKRIKTRLGL